MAFGDLKSAKGVKALNEHLATRSYVEGYQPSQADTEAFEALASAPEASLAHALRWYNHIKSFDNRKKFPASQGSSAAKSAPADEDDDDIDLFGSDSEDEETKKLKEERLQMYAAKKSKKPTLIAKSSVLFDIKPWDDETDMKKMEECVRTVVKDGLVWGASKLVPVGYGIHKLQILCIIEDEKISTDLLSEEITEFEDYVQSVDIAAFNKI